VHPATLEAAPHARSTTADFAAFRERTFFTSLDGLRALSILGVVWHHTAASDFRDVPLLSSGNFGVALFFVISGFLITTLLLREEDRHGSIALRAFYARRALRIFPLYYAVLLLYATTVLVFERHSEAGAAFFQNLPYFATYTNNLVIEGEERVIFYFAWSLAAEEQFYLLWPLLAKHARRALSLAVLGAGVLLAVLYQEDLLPDAALDSSFEFFLARLMLPIFLGVFSAYALHDRRTFAVCARTLGHPLGAPVIGALILLMLANGEAPLSLIHLAFALLVVSSVVRPDHGLHGLLDQPHLRQLGVVSYGVYLLHMLSLNGARRVLDPLGVESGVALFALTLPLACGAAWLSRRYFESWFLARKTAFAR
jgi:peptidoglycan/LPS O-acetylase OafA/YrhL